MATRTLKRLPTLDAEDTEQAARNNAANELPVQCFKDGPILSRFAKDHCACVRGLIKGKRDFVPMRAINLGYDCVGSASE